MALETANQLEIMYEASQPPQKVLSSSSEVPA